MLSRVDDAKRGIVKLLTNQPTLEFADLVELFDASNEELDAALVELASEVKVALTSADEEFRARTGFTYSRVSAHRS